MENQVADTTLVPEAGQTSVDTTTDPLQDVGQGDAGQVAENTPEVKYIPEEQYNNLRREFTRKSMELADIKKGRVAPPQMQQQAPDMVVPRGMQPFTPQPSQYANIGDYIDDRVNEVLEPLEQQQRELAIQTTIKSLADQYEDFDDVADDFVELIEQKPELLDLDGGIEVAFMAARASYLENNAQAIAIAEYQAKQETIAQKQGLDSTQGYARQQGGGAKTEEDALRESIVGTREKSIFGF